MGLGPDVFAAPPNLHKPRQGGQQDQQHHPGSNQVINHLEQVPTGGVPGSKWRNKELDPGQTARSENVRKLEKHAGHEGETDDLGDPPQRVIKRRPRHDVNTDQKHENNSPAASVGVEHRHNHRETVAGRQLTFPSRESA